MSNNEATKTKRISLSPDEVKSMSDRDLALINMGAGRQHDLDSLTLVKAEFDARTGRLEDEIRYYRDRGLPEEADDLEKAARRLGHDPQVAESPQEASDG